MNQGNDKAHAGDDGVFHDGCLMFQYPTGRFLAFFMAFQSQSFDTDDHTGHAEGTSLGMILRKGRKSGPARKRARPRRSR